MKKVDSAINSTAAGEGWFKIYQDGYDNSTDKFCTEKLIASNGELSLLMPNDIETGYYLVRTELIALHLTGSPQLFISCAQFFLQSGGTATPADTVSIPGHIKHSDPIVLYSVYNRPFVVPFPYPGPPVYIGRGNLTSTPNNVSAIQTEGFCPPGTVLENGNWCGVEVPRYNSSDECQLVSSARLNLSYDGI